LCHRSCNK